MRNREKLDNIMMEVRENSIRLENCPGHIFFPIKHKVGRYKCDICKGEVESSFMRGYTQGLEHAKGDK